jgi:antirestriction protein ArdC
MKPDAGHHPRGRCNRELGKRFGDKAYSVEELIAELTAFVCAHLGAEQCKQRVIRDSRAKSLKWGVWCPDWALLICKKEYSSQ